MANPEAGKPAVRRWTLNFITITFSIALALLYVLVLRSISVQIAPPPESLTEPYPDISTQEQCEAEGGRWIENVPGKNIDTRSAVPAPIEEARPYCQGPLTFEREREKQNEDSQQMMLFVFAIGGGIAVAASLLVHQLRPVAPGLMIGGIVSFFIAGIQIWILAPGIGRLATIVAIFLILVGVGLYALRREEAK